MLRGPTQAVLEVEVTRLVDEMIGRNLGRIVRRVHGRSVIGVLFHARIPTWAMVNDHAQLVTVNHLDETTEDPVYRLFLDQVLKGLER